MSRVYYRLVVLLLFVCVSSANADEATDVLQQHDEIQQERVDNLDQMQLQRQDNHEEMQQQRVEVQEQRQPVRQQRR